MAHGFKNNTLLYSRKAKPVSIRKFQELQIEIRAVNALYLDMGTWSEGWYKNYFREILEIGETMVNTNKQSNWIIYKKGI